MTPRRRARPRWDGRVPDQAGRHVVVTGAGGGLGLELTRRLSGAGARVTMAVRDPTRLPNDVRRWPGVTPAVLDLSDLSSVRRFAERTGPVDVLVANAGVMGVPPTRTADGFELQLATNHLGHFALTNLLLPRLSDRVVVVASRSHAAGELPLDDLNWERRRYRRYAAYGQSKLANLLFTSELQRRLTAVGSTLRAVAAHPGYTSTGIQGRTGVRSFTALADLGNRVVGMPVERGVLPLLFAAMCDIPGNSYLGPDLPLQLHGRPVQVGRSALASDPELAKQLWLASEELTGVRFPLG